MQLFQGDDDEFDQEVATVNGYKDGKTSSQTADSTAADATTTITNSIHSRRNRVKT